MNYFCDVHVQSRQNEEARIFVVLDSEKIPESGLPNLTKEILMSNNQYKDFETKYRPKFVLAEYTVYSTESEIYASSQDEVFVGLIQNQSVEIVGQAELNIDCAKEKNAKRKTKKKKKKTSPVLKIALISGCLLAVAGSFFVGIFLGKSQSKEVSEEVSEKTANEDGMIIPVQEEIAENSEQITVSIDRSYSAVPREDLQIKGEIVDGSAQIMLPEFDKNDFFTHVSGYTWGFSTNPDGKKIEYYGGVTYSFSEDTKLYRVLVKYGGGSGTKDDPYIINYFDQLEMMSEEKARGYFKQTADIEFPVWATHTPINTVNKLKSEPQDECFEYDGNGFAIKNLDNPLFGTVSGAVIKNVNIQNSNINVDSLDSDYGFIACRAYNYRYETEKGKVYETGETLIKHCTVSGSAIHAEIPKSEDETEEVEVVTAPVVVPPDVVERDEDGNIIEKPTETEEVKPTKKAEFSAGAITGTGGQIEDCYVANFGIYANLDEYILYAGGISGKPANVVNSAVYNFSASGHIFNAGGISGSCGGSGLYDPTGNELPDFYGGNIQGCTVRKASLYTENSAGGITGEGSTNAENSVISNCYANELELVSEIPADEDSEEPAKSGYLGGIIGADGKNKNGQKIMNTVSPENFKVIGNKKKSQYDDSVRLAPDYAFYQENILTVLNKNTISPDNPQEIYTGNFMFDKSLFGDETGGLPFPSEISDLFGKIFVEDSNGTESE